MCDSKTTPKEVAKQETEQADENFDISDVRNDDLEFYIKIKDNAFIKLSVQEIKKYSLIDSKSKQNKVIRNYASSNLQTKMSPLKTNKS